MTNFAARQEFKFVNNKKMKNRIVLAPLTHNMSQDNGDLSKDEIDWLAKCALGGFGMLITAATSVSPSGRCWQGQPGLFTDTQQEQFKAIAKNAKKSNTLAIVQLHHGGIRTAQQYSKTRPVAPSKVTKNANTPDGAQALSRNEIDVVIQNFVDSAERAYHAGMSGIEIHAAFNFLLSNFSNPLLNKRTDQWGGSFENRSRILFSIVTQIRSKLSRDFIIGVRLSPENYSHFSGIDINEQIKLANELTKLNIDYIHMSLHDAFKKPDHNTEGSLSLLEWIKQTLDPNIPLIVAGKISTITDADKAIAMGADFVALGTVAVGNPDWVNKVNAGVPLTEAPYSTDHLIDLGFNTASIDYLSSISGLVAA
jgi:2,4-dienoyl-CoA reductase-like NADH-dependent reductase (Old Yellow Enzyme family)